MSVTIETTERKRAEEALRASEARHRLLAETMLQGVVHQDAGGQDHRHESGRRAHPGQNARGISGE